MEQLVQMYLSSCFSKGCNDLPRDRRDFLQPQRTPPFKQMLGYQNIQSVYYVSCELSALDPKCSLLGTLPIQHIVFKVMIEQFLNDCSFGPLPHGIMLVLTGIFLTVCQNSDTAHPKAKCKLDLDCCRIQIETSPTCRISRAPSWQINRLVLSLSRDQRRPPSRFLPSSSATWYLCTFTAMNS